MPFRFRILLLLLLLCIEMMLFYSVVGLGWYETTAALSWLRAVAIASIPIAIAGIFICRDGRRFSLRTLMILVACVACFIAIAMLPILDAKQSRIVTANLMQLGAKLDMTPFTSGLFRHLSIPRPSNAEEHAKADRLPEWLRPIAGRMLETPMDCQIRQITINSDDQMSLLMANAKKFVLLEAVLLNGPGVSSASISSFSDSFSDFPELKTVHFGNVAVPNDCLPKMTSLIYLSIHARNPPPPGTSGFRLTDLQLETIGNLPSLKVISCCDYDISNDDLAMLAPCSKLKYLMLYGADVTDAALEEFKLAHPECELIVK